MLIINLRKFGTPSVSFFCQYSDLAFCVSSSMSSTEGYATRFKEVGQSVIAARRPWRELLDLTALGLPSSLSDATIRLTHNLTRFLFNYTLIILLIVFLSLIYHPFSLIVFLLVFIAWYFLYLSRDEPLRVFGFEFGDPILVAVLGIVTFLALLWTAPWVNLLVSIVIGIAVACLHAVLRGTEDLVGDDQESPYGNLLSDSPRGDYSGF